MPKIITGFFVNRLLLLLAYANIRSSNSTRKAGQKMKLAFSTTGENLDSPLDPSFGRARNFLFYDLQTQAVDIRSNQQNLAAAQGAGIQAAQTIAKGGAQALITGHCGPKAFRALDAAGIKVFNTDAATVAEALARYRAGELVAAQAANAEGHWA
jgi:predicted Fe-Mo cluster-binding NifX family protein